MVDGRKEGHTWESLPLLRNSVSSTLKLWGLFTLFRSNLLFLGVILASFYSLVPTNVISCRNLKELCSVTPTSTTLLQPGYILRTGLHWKANGTLFFVLGLGKEDGLTDTPQNSVIQNNWLRFCYLANNFFFFVFNKPSSGIFNHFSQNLLNLVHISG